MIKAIVVLLVLAATSPAIAEEWILYVSTDLVSAYYDKGTKLDHTITVKWVYKKKSGTGEADPNPFQLIRQFRAYCSTRQLFTINRDDSLSEVDVVPGTLYEATWKLICGEH